MPVWKRIESEVGPVDSRLSIAAILNASGEEECAEIFDLEEAFLMNTEQEGECELEEQKTGLPEDILLYTLSKSSSRSCHKQRGL